MVVVAGCSGASVSGGPVDGGPANADALGHCDGPDGTPVFQTVSEAACHDDAGAPEEGDAEYGATLYGSSGYGDDCKYQVSWTSTPLAQNEDVTFTATVKIAATGEPATGGTANDDTYVEAFLNDVHPGDTASAHSSETSPGVYEIGPVRFDAPGIWTVRFHLFGDCEDANPESPHGHAAFFVEVP